MIAPSVNPKFKSYTLSQMCLSYDIMFFFKGDHNPSAEPLL